MRSGVRAGPWRCCAWQCPGWLSASNRPRRPRHHRAGRRRARRAAARARAVERIRRGSRLRGSASACGFDYEAPTPRTTRARSSSTLESGFKVRDARLFSGGASSASGRSPRRPGSCTTAPPTSGSFDRPGSWWRCPSSGATSSSAAPRKASPSTRSWSGYAGWTLERCTINDAISRSWPTASSGSATCPSAHLSGTSACTPTGSPRGRASRPTTPVRRPPGLAADRRGQRRYACSTSA